MAQIKGIKIAPSLLAADPLNFEADLKSVEEAGADYHHVDVMDGHFVPNLTYGLPLVKALKKKSSIPLDVHIMVSNPDTVAMQYVEAGADILVFHIEAATHSHKIIQEIKNSGAKAGVAINPGTSLHALEAVLPYVDIVNVMSVNPGFGGQSFIEDSVSRISQLAESLKRIGRDKEVDIEVDGGVSSATVERIVTAGANFLVAGTYVYGAENRATAIQSLRL